MGSDAPVYSATIKRAACATIKVAQQKVADQV